jgi:signal transduction histidine kinase
VGLADPTWAASTTFITDALLDEARLESLIDDLLLLARIDARRALRPPVPLDLGRVVADELGRRLGDRVPVALDVPDAGPVVHGDPAQLSRVVRNLVDNAVRHATSCVEVEVRPIGEPPDRVAVVQVHDDGSGIPEADRARVFERFTRLDHARAAADGGSGLGLAIVVELVAAHEGTVGFVDAERGATVVVRLPLADGPAGDTHIGDRRL